MRRELVIAAGPGEWRAAWLEDGDPVELHVERGETAPAGSILLGRVVRRVAGLDAALVDIGEARPGFLPGRDPTVTEGARAVVQVRREAQRGKGAQLTARIAPNSTVQAARVASVAPPARLDPPPGLGAALAARLPGMPERVVIDDPAAIAELRGVCPGAEVVRSDPAEWPLDLDAAFEAALSPVLGLPGGGVVHIEESPAAVLIDVDTGSPDAGSAERTAISVNLAAAAAIARQLRLRQLGGGIVVDFAALDGRGPRDRVRRAVETGLQGDPAQPQVLGWTRLGHLEIVRPRRLRSLGDAMLEPLGAGKTPATLAFEALRTLSRESRFRPSAAWRLVVRPAVAAALRGPAAVGLAALEARLGRPIALQIAPDGAVPPFDLVPSEPICAP